MNTSVVSPGRAGLILLLTGQMLPLIDTSITNVALDSITHSLHATATELELIVALYGVAFAVCLALGSKLGDNLGRRRLFMWGVAAFGVASLLCGMAGSVEQLLGARVLQGAGAALIVNSFYRIGMRDISSCDAGAGSAILSTLQQATLGLGPAILGTLFLTFARHNGGHYPQAMIGFLSIEVVMMLALGGIALWLRHRLEAGPLPAAS